MSGTTAFPASKYYKDAQIMLEKKDLLEFVSKINITIELSSEDSEMMSKATYLKSKGLMNFNQHTKALASIEEALKFNHGVQSFELRKLKGTANGFLGNVDKATRIFKELLAENIDDISVVRVCINLAWAYLTLDKKNHSVESLAEAKKYLDMANQHSDTLTDHLKRKILNNYSVYFYYLNDYDKAIDSLNQAFDYATEKDLPRLYNNLAEVYIKYREVSGMDFCAIAEYLDKSEIIASNLNDKIEMAFSFYARAKLELLNEEIFTALDTLYLAFDFFTEAEAYSYSLECLLKINELVSQHKADCMRTMQEKLNNKIKGNPYLEKI